MIIWRLPQRLPKLLAGILTRMKANGPAALIAPMLGGSHTVGVVAHFVIGTFVFPIAYLILGIRKLPGPAWLRGALFLIPVYLTAMVVVIPILGQGLFFGSPPKAMVALMGHVVFGLVMGAIIGKPVNE